MIRFERARPPPRPRWPQSTPPPVCRTAFQARDVVSASFFRRYVAAKLVLVRRIVKALVGRHGLQRVQQGMRSPIVVDIVVREVLPETSGLSAATLRRRGHRDASTIEGGTRAVGERDGNDGREGWGGQYGRVCVETEVRDGEIRGEPVFGRELLRVHTVAPSTAPGVDGFRLGAIVESPSPRVAERGRDDEGGFEFGDAEKDEGT